MTTEKDEYERMRRNLGYHLRESGLYPHAELRIWHMPDGYEAQLMVDGALMWSRGRRGMAPMTLSERKRIVSDKLQEALESLYNEVQEEEQVQERE